MNFHEVERTHAQYPLMYLNKFDIIQLYEIN